MDVRHFTPAIVPAGEFSAPKAECRQIDMSPRPSQSTQLCRRGVHAYFVTLQK
jgi:hypothetical protein